MRRDGQGSHTRAGESVVLDVGPEQTVRARPVGARSPSAAACRIPREWGGSSCAPPPGRRRPRSNEPRPAHPGSTSRSTATPPSNRGDPAAWLTMSSAATSSRPSKSWALKHAPSRSTTVLISLVIRNRLYARVRRRPARGVATRTWRFIASACSGSMKTGRGVHVNTYDPVRRHASPSWESTRADARRCWRGRLRLARDRRREVAAPQGCRHVLVGADGRAAVKHVAGDRARSQGASTRVPSRSHCASDRRSGRAPQRSPLGPRFGAEACERSRAHHSIATRQRSSLHPRLTSPACRRPATAGPAPLNRREWRLIRAAGCEAG